MEREHALYADTLATIDNPDDVALRFGRAFAQRGAYRHALEYLNRASGSARSRLDAVIELGYCYQLLDEEETMWRAYDQYMAESDDFVTAGLEVLERFERPRFAEHAVTLLDRLVSEAPDRFDLQRQRLVRLFEIGDWRRLHDQAVAFILTADEPAVAANDVVWLLRARVETAQGVLEEVMTACPDLHALNLAAGRIHLQLSREALGSPMARDGHRATARRFHLAFLDGSGQGQTELISAGDVLLSHGMYDLAFRAYSDALALGAPLTPIRWSYVHTAMRTGVSIEDVMPLIRDEMDDSDDPVRVAIDAVGVLAEIHRVGAVLPVAELGLDSAEWDASRNSLFMSSAPLFVEAGLHDALRELSDQFVSVSSDQATALRVAARHLEEANQLDLAEEYLSLALERVPGQPEVVAALARIAFYRGESGEAQERFRRYAEQAGVPWRAWWEYGTLLWLHGRHQDAADAFDQAVAAGGDSAQLHLDRGRIAARLGDRQGAVTALETALDRLETEAMTGAERLAILETVDEISYLLPTQDAVVALWESMIVDETTRESALLTLAENALNEGNSARGRQLLQTYVESGFPADTPVMMQLELGLVDAALEQIREVVFEGDPSEAAGLLTDHADAVVSHLGTATLRVWVEEVLARGAMDGAPLLRVLADSYLRVGDIEAAIPVLGELARQEPKYNLALLNALTVSGASEEIITPLRAHFVSGGTSQEELRHASIALATAAATGGASHVGTALEILSRDPSTPFAASLEVDWLLAHGDGARAVSRLWAQDVLGYGDALEQSRQSLLRRGYLTEATAFTGDGSSHGIEKLLFEVRVAAARDQSTETAVSDYLNRANGQPGLILALGRTLAHVSDARQAERVLDALLEDNHAPADRLAALTALLRAAVAAGDEAIAERAVERYVDGSGLRRQALMDGAELCDRYGRWSCAADLFEAALRLTPRDPGLVGSLLQVLFKAGRFDEAASLVETAHMMSLASFRDLSLSTVAYGGGGASAPLVDALYQRTSALAVRDAELAAARAIIESGELPTMDVESPSEAEAMSPSLANTWTLDQSGMMVPDGWHRVMRAFVAAGRASDGVAHIEEHAAGFRAYPVGLIDVEPLVELLDAAGDREAAELVLRDTLAWDDSPRRMFELAVYLAGHEETAAEARQLARRAWADLSYREPDAIIGRAVVAGSSEEGFREAFRVLTLR